MGPIKVGVDLDGVLCNFSFKFSEILNKLYKSPILKDRTQIKQWNWHLWYPLPKKLIDDAWEHIIKYEYDFWVDLLPLDYTDLLTFRNEIYNNYKVDTYFITSRVQTPGDSVVKQSQFWLNERGFKNPSVIVSDKKGIVCDALDISYFIDDKWDNCVEVKSRNPLCKVFCLNAEYNKEFVDNLGIIRVDNLKEFSNYIIKGM